MSGTSANADNRPLPRFSPHAKPYWDACLKSRLILQRCTECANIQFPPRAACARCWQDTIEWIDASGRGVVHSYSIVSRPPEASFQSMVPYAVALIDLSEGPRMLSNVVGCAPEDVRIGMEVTVEFQKIAAGVALPVFRPSA